MNENEYPPEEVYRVHLALEEALFNAHKHGHAGRWDKPVTVRFHVGSDGVVVQVEDEGPGFDPALVPDPLAPENLDTARPGDLPSSCELTCRASATTGRDRSDLPLQNISSRRVPRRSPTPRGADVAPTRRTSAAGLVRGWLVQYATSRIRGHGAAPSRSPSRRPSRRGGAICRRSGPSLRVLSRYPDAVLGSGPWRGRTSLAAVNG